MKKKVIALILVIPLIVMLTIFTVSKTASLSVEVPATGIILASSNVDGALSLDMATYQDDYVFKAEVQPSEAKNRGYTISVSDEDEYDDCCISVDNDGRLTLNRAGQATITATSNDKGFTTALDVSVYSTKVYDMAVTVKDEAGDIVALDRQDSGNVDYILASLDTGTRLDFDGVIFPSSLRGEDIEWSSSNNMGLEIDSHSGIAECRLSGDYLVTATVHNAIGGDLKKTCKVTLSRDPGVTGIAVQGINYGDTATLNVAPNVSETRFLIESDTRLMKEDICSDDVGFVVTDMRQLGDSPYVYEVTARFGAMALGDRMHFSVGAFGSTERFLATLECAEYTLEIATPRNENISKDVIYQKRGMTATYSPLVSPYANKICHWEIDGDIATIEEVGNACKVIANKTGSATLTLVATIMGKEYRESRTLTIVEHVTNPQFRDKANNGISKVNAITDTDIVNGKYQQYSNMASITCLVNGVRQGVDISDFAINSSDESVARVGEDGTIDILKTGEVTLMGTWRYADYFDEVLATKVRIKVVKDGVYVDSSSDLIKASEDGRRIVLDSDIDFASDMTESEITSLLDSHKYYTTFDWTYYANLDKDSANPTHNARPFVRYIVEFKDSVYGNGHSINMQTITKAYDGNNPKYFKGPLDFVAMASRASVKGQDNICFLVREPNVTLDNVTLKGCSDERLIKNDRDGQPYLELSELNYVGTVLEIAGDNTRLVNSRVSNGRNVVRIYGGGVDGNGSPILRRRLTYSEVARERIRVSMESCILSHAREFILKEGTNRALLSETRTDITKFVTESLMDKNGVPFDHKSKVFDETDRDFYDNAVLTDVTLKNSVLDTSGLFSIGIESHFGGYFLTGEGDFKRQLRSYSWYDLAATSYAAVLRLEGDVRLYDWKDISRVDSSTLVESEGDKGEILSQIVNLDIGKMIKKVSSLAGDSRYAHYGNILTDYEHKTYVHGGIAFYGGGKNYAKIDLSRFSGDAFTKYDVNIRVLAVGEEADMSNSNYVQGTMLPCAAGEEDFTFYMYDKGSTFDYARQLRDLECGDAYNWIKGV